MREDSATKARRLLAEGRLLITHVGSGGVGAKCRGDSGDVYRLGWDGEEWFCNCPAKSVRCSHVQALQLVTVRQAEPS